MSSKQRNALKSKESSQSTDSINSSINSGLGRIDPWFQKKSTWIIALLLFGWLITRVSLFTSVVNEPIYVLYQWDDSDNRFFDDWAKRIAAGDVLGREAYHPYHSWHKAFAEYYFQKHPEKEREILEANPNRDSTFVAGEELWNEWYRGNTFHQEPLYPYLLAVLYKLTGNGVYWMLFLQCIIGLISGFILWKISKKYFGDTVAFISGILYLLCGIILFQETVLLRTTWTVFFTLLNIWTFDLAFEKRTRKSFFIAGITLAAGFLMQSTISLFFIGMMIVYAFLERKQPVILLKNGLAALAGFILLFSPVMIRNAIVGAPLTSSSSVGAITFLAANVYESNTVNNWYPEKEKCAEIMGRNDGKFLPVVLDALKTHPSIFTYLINIWQKLISIFMGVEFSSNENYYFYKSQVPILEYTPIKFSVLAAFGLVGLLFAIYHRKQFWGFYISILLQFAVLLGFYVSGRLRTPLAALLIPFVAYAIVECFSVFRDKKTGMIKIAITLILGYFLYYRNISFRTQLRSADMITVYDKYYIPKIEDLDALKDWKALSKLHYEFIKRFEPAFVKSLTIKDQLVYVTDVSIVRYLARHYEIQSQVCELANEKEYAERYKNRSQELYEIVKHSEQNAKL